MVPALKLEVKADDQADVSRFGLAANFPASSF